MTEIPVLAVVGPTASGKTALSVALAERFDAEIVSFDSMQLYKGMDVATAKPTKEEMRDIPHHLIDCVDPQEEYSVARYKEDADRILQEIHARGKQCIMVGGTGLYLDTVLQNIQFLETDRDPGIREALSAECEKYGLPAMYEALENVDPEYAAKVDRGNRKRVLRALEVYRATGYTMSDQIRRSRAVPSPYRPTYLGLNTRDRAVLYDRINRRVDLMIENGLLEETRLYLEEGAGSTAAQAIGIKEMVPYLRGEASLEECRDRLQTVTRHYAKRQLTWFRRNEDVRWLYLEDYPSAEDLVQAAYALAVSDGYPNG